MQKANKLLCLVAIASSAVAVFTTARMLSLSGKLAETGDKRVEEPAAAAEACAQSAAAGTAAVAGTAAQSAAAGEEAAPEPKTVYREMKVQGFGYDGNNTVTIVLSEKPDMNVVKQYVTAGPLEKGNLAFGLTTRREWHGNGVSVKPALWITGEWAHRTNITVRIKKGFPLASVETPSAPGVTVVNEPLAEDYVHAFVRRDREPTVEFADKGRYLPPMGRREVALKSVNVSNIVASVSAVPPANIVQMLALEEDVYDNIYRNRRYWSREDDSFVKDISAARWKTNIAMPNKLNEEERTTLRLRPPNGVYFVSVGSEEDDVDDCRVVCVTDLGLSVRRDSNGTYVWVTSLSKGTPAPDIAVETYSSANERLGRAITGPDGIAFIEERGKTGSFMPFAVVASAQDGSDISFIAMHDATMLDERFAGDEAYTRPESLDVFAWTDRGIYRHGEKILFHALVRNGAGFAPQPLPLELHIKTPSNDTYLKRSVMTDAFGSILCDDIAIPADQPSGEWTFSVRTPGKDGIPIGRRKIKVEEFAPPQIRVKTVAATGVKPQDFSFTVSAEHLYGGPASDLACEGAVVFEDVPFAPAGWEGWSFGDSSRGLVPNFRTLAKSKLDAKGECTLAAPIWSDHGKPAAAVRATAQGTVFEDGGRPATSRDSTVLHYYPYYIGTTLTQWLRLPGTGRAKINVACVAADGRRLAEAKSLRARLERIDSVYSCKVDEETNFTAWNCEHVRTTVAEDIPVEVPSGDGCEFEIPTDECGDYTLTIADPAGDVSFGMTFYLSSWGDESIRAPLSNPTRVSVSADKPFYRPGETPRLRVRSPFAGTALVTVMRDNVVYNEVLQLTNATCEVELRPVEPDWAPNVNVSVNVLQAVAENTRHMAAKARGEATVSVRRPENEIEVSVVAAFEGREVSAQVHAPDAKEAVITLVDEGINILTGEPVPDPIAYFSSPKVSFFLPYYDLYRRILPVLGEGGLAATGVKTGGGYGAEMLDRISPVATRRFKPLAMWREKIPVVDGNASATFTIPEFVGEVRVTAVAYSETAAGAASVQCKVAPKLVAQPDAPRFAAPGDEFEVTLPLANRAGEDGEAEYGITCDGVTVAKGAVRLANGETKVLRFPVKAPAVPGLAAVRYVSKGFGETHETEIEVPVRPAVAWVETSGVEKLDPGAGFTPPQQGGGTLSKFRYHVAATPLAELRAALECLAGYPYECLEQTSSRIFPLVSAGGLLNAVGSVEAVNRAEYVAAGVRRVESMVRNKDFVMWPDCNYAPWDVEVSLYAAHFLIEAERGGVPLESGAKTRVMEFLGRWAMSPTNSVSAYACHTLALAGKPEKDRMFRLYDSRSRLDLVSRARLARAFAAIGDRARAGELVKNADSPESVKEASFLLLALLDLDPEDARCARLVEGLLARRDKNSMSWLTTGDNAHALLAIGEYWRHHPVKPGRPDVREVDGRLVNVGEGTAFVAWKRLVLPSPEEVEDESRGIAIRREFLTAGGEPCDLAKAKCGDLVMVRLSISSEDERDLSDLVVEDLFAGAMEPVHGALDPALYPWIPQDSGNWVMRTDTRDDRILVFSKKFHLKKNEEARFHYPLRVVSAGSFALPKVAVEAMYQPGLRARSGGGRVVAGH